MMNNIEKTADSEPNDDYQMSNNYAELYVHINGFISELKDVIGDQSSDKAFVACREERQTAAAQSLLEYLKSDEEKRRLKVWIVIDVYVYCV